MDNAVKFENVAAFDAYAEQILARIQMPLGEDMSQLMETCFGIIGHHLVTEYHVPEPEQPTDKMPLNSTGEKLSFRQISLLYIYNGDVINRKNAGAIVKIYGRNSGDGLYNKHIIMLKLQNRLAVRGRQAVDMLDNISAIKHLLEGDALIWAEREEKIIRSNI